MQRQKADDKAKPKRYRSTKAEMAIKNAGRAKKVAIKRALKEPPYVPTTDWDLQLLSSDIEPGDTLDISLEDESIVQMLWLGDEDSKFVYLLDETRTRRKFRKICCDEYGKQGLPVTIAGKSKTSLRL